jgi:hypothetical protein
MDAPPTSKVETDDVASPAVLDGADTHKLR